MLHMQLKVLSWNIWYDGQFDQISEFLRSSDADIIGLQEVLPDDPTRDTVGFLAKLGYYHVLAPVAKIKDGRTMSNAIFSKFKIGNTKTYILSEIDSRNAVSADVIVGESILHVFSTHLLHTHQKPSETQDIQVKNLINVLSKGRTIVMGDFNATPESGVIKKMRDTMVDTHLLSVATLNNRSFDCRLCDSETIATIRLDYIFTSPDIKSSSFHVGNSIGSDHLPITVTIEI